MEEHQSGEINNVWKQLSGKMRKKFWKRTTWRSARKKRTKEEVSRRSEGWSREARIVNLGNGGKTAGREFSHSAVARARVGGIVIGASSLLNTRITFSKQILKKIKKHEKKGKIKNHKNLPKKEKSNKTTIQKKRKSIKAIKSKKKKQIIEKNMKYKN